MAQRSDRVMLCLKNILTIHYKRHYNVPISEKHRQTLTRGCGRPQEMGRGGPVRVIVLATLFFWLAKVALSSAQAPSFQPSKQLRADEISIPSSLGYVLETHQPDSPSSPQGPIIIHIQDAHTNYEAQQNIVAILEQLIEHYGLKLILVEGSQGDASLAYLRKYGPPENRKQVADKYLKAGIISAEEYLDIVSDHPLTLWGVEDKALYDQNVDAFLAAESLQGSLKPLLTSVRDAAEALRPHLSHPSLTTLDTQARAFERHELSLADYAKTLKDLAAPLGVAPDPASNLSRFLRVHALEQSMSLAKVQQEQQALIGALSDRAPADQLEELVNQAIRMKEGKIKPVEFYTLLEQLAAASKISLASYPQLADYIGYVKDSAIIDPTELARELDAFSADLRQRLAVTPESRQLGAILEEVDLLEKLLDLRLSPEEHRRLQAVNLQSLSSRWASFLTTQLQRQGLPARSFAGLGDVEASVATLQQFYDVAQRRDTLLVSHAVAKLHETSEPIAVLITGGFHSTTITQLLKDQGIGTVVLTPKVSTPTNERLYHAVVKYKSGHGSFDEVMAIANEQAPSTKSQIPNKSQ